jgi:methyl-accepting chemotaxis protein
MTDQIAGAANRRKKLLVDKQTQGHLIQLLVAFALVILVLVLMVVFFASHGKAGALPLLVSLLLSMILILIGVAYLGLRFSNKIVGPMFNFGRNLQLVQRGDYTSVVRLRHGDEFQNTAGVFNLALDALRGRVQEDIAFLDKLSAEIAKTSDGNKDALLGAIKDYRSTKERHITKEPN